MVLLKKKKKNVSTYFFSQKGKHTWLVQGKPWVVFKLWSVKGNRTPVLDVYKKKCTYFDIFYFEVGTSLNKYGLEYLVSMGVK